MYKIVLSTLLSLGFLAGYAQYNPKENPFEQIQNTVKLAQKSQKHILVLVGGDWCIWCKRFNHLINNNDSIQNLLSTQYEKVYINYSKENKNTIFLNAYGNPQRFGYPVFMILDEHGKLIHTQNSAYLEDGKTGHDANKVYDFLQSWTYNAVHQIKE